MNRSIFFSLVMFLALLTGCKEDEKAPVVVEESLTIDATFLSFAAGGGSDHIDVTSNANWTVSRGEAEWVTLSPTSGEGDARITVTAAPYDGDEDRSATITVASQGGIKRNVTVMQSEFQVVFSVTPSVTEITFSADGEVATNSAGIAIPTVFTVEGNVAWNVVSDKEEEWLSVDIKENGFELIATPNTDPVAPPDAKVTITIREGITFREITVKQLPFSGPLNVTGISPVRGGFDTQVEVSGENFGINQAIVSVFFNDRQAEIVSMQDDKITVKVPKQALGTALCTIKVIVDEEDFELQEQKFHYIFTPTMVTTIAGTGANSTQDGPALQATFVRPTRLAVDDIGNVLISDDNGNKVRLLNTNTNEVSTVHEMAIPWASAMNPQYSHYYVVHRRNATHPTLFWGLSKASGYTQAVKFEDQKDEDGNWIFGNTATQNDREGLAACETYVYLMKDGSDRLVRVHQQTGKVELMANTLILDLTGSNSAGRYATMNYNKLDGMIYVVAEQVGGRIYRFDPTHTPADRTTPWITMADVEWIAGQGNGTAASAINAQGRDIRFRRPGGLKFDKFGNMYVNDPDLHGVWKLDPDLNGVYFTGGNSTTGGYANGPVLDARFDTPNGIAVTEDGIIFIGENGRYIRRIDQE